MRSRRRARILIGIAAIAVFAVSVGPVVLAGIGSVIPDRVLFDADAEVHSDVQHLIKTATVRGYVYGGSVPLANELAAVLSTREWDRVNDALVNDIERGAVRATDAKPLSYELADLQGNVVEAEIDPFAQ